MKYEDHKHAEAINRVLFRISNAINTTNDLSQLYASIHRTLRRIIDDTNFFVALYDSEKRTLRFPYYRDEIDKELTELVVDYDISDSLTGQVISDRKPVLLNREALLKWKAQGRLQGTLPLTWIGVPLINDDKVIGVTAVQSYTDPDIFDGQDTAVLASVSDQVALAIALGVDPRRLASGVAFVELFSPHDMDRVSSLLDNIADGQNIEGQEHRLRKRDREEMVALLYSSPVVKSGEVVGARVNITDITLRKMAEEQRDSLISELRKTLAEIKILKGTIPICASCKKIRDDSGY